MWCTALSMRTFYNKMALYNESSTKDSEKAVVIEGEAIENDRSAEMRSTKWS